MRRAQTIIAGGVVLLAAFVLIPACSTADAGPGCGNATKDEGEEGVDCGGTCPSKCTGTVCAGPAECASGKCEAGKCGAPAGKTCGVGVSGLCKDGDKCELDKDCTSGFCDGATCAVPAAGSHSDGKKNGGETGIDCGGSVKVEKPCPDGQGCTDSSDCVGTCNSGTCGAIGPTDGKKNNGETDVDCGGAKAPPCPNGKACETNTDCKDKYCPAAQKKCVEPRADDGVQNGTETDVDCGGASGKKCGEAKSCLVDGDCIGACNYLKKCSDAPSCKPKLGGYTCGAGEVGAGGEMHESCCKTLPTGYSDPKNVGKTVYLDKYEITAGRVRAFIEAITEKNAGVPNVKAWIAANMPPLWDPAWSAFLPSGAEVENIVVPRNPSNNTEPPPWNRNAGTNFQFNGQLYIYAHGHNCINSASSYGFPTFWLPADVMAKNGGLPRADGFDGAGVKYLAKDYLDVKSATCVTNAMLAAFCHWDGGQLATDMLLDFVTNNATPGNQATCGTRCAPITDVIASSDSGSTSTNYLYNFPFFADGTTHEGTARIAAPGRAVKDVVRINAGAEPWMDLHGNTQEAVLDVRGALKFGMKYRGIGFNSSRAINNSTNLVNPEYKAGYISGRCMRFK